MTVKDIDFSSKEDFFNTCEKILQEKEYLDYIFENVNYIIEYRVTDDCFEINIVNSDGYILDGGICSGSEVDAIKFMINF